MLDHHCGLSLTRQRAGLGNTTTTRVFGERRRVKTKGPRCYSFRHRRVDLLFLQIYPTLQTFARYVHLTVEADLSRTCHSSISAV
jgi:hypothetical protein